MFQQKSRVACSSWYPVAAPVVFTNNRVALATMSELTHCFCVLPAVLDIKGDQQVTQPLNLLCLNQNVTCLALHHHKSVGKVGEGRSYWTSDTSCPIVSNISESEKADKQGCFCKALQMARWLFRHTAGKRPCLPTTTALHSSRHRAASQGKQQI